MTTISIASAPVKMADFNAIQTAELHKRPYRLADLEKIRIAKLGAMNH